jgi:hypothetical protein
MESRKITFAKSANLLGYSDRELVGADFSVIIPHRYDNAHSTDAIFNSIFCHRVKNRIFTEVSPLLAKNKFGYLVPVIVKLRLCITKSGQMRIILFIRAMKKFNPFALLDGGKIEQMTPCFENFLTMDLGIP